jgi:predicted nucleotidyltransferase
MSKIPKIPQEIFPELTNDFKQIFGAQLVSLILYGSGARGDYGPGKSDINLLIIHSQDVDAPLDLAMKTVHKWKKQRVAVPLFMTRAFVLSSVDAYPIEFLNMKLSHLVIYGQDILDDVTFDPGHLRLQLERELKGKLIRLQTGFLETEGKSKQIRELIKASFNAFLALSNAMLFLKNIPIPKDRTQVIGEMARAFSIDPAVFLKCADIKEDRDPFSSTDIQTIFHDYLQEIRKLSEMIDYMMEHHEI